MGTAFLAEREGKWFVVKVLNRELADRFDFRQRLRRELESLRRIESSHAPAVIAEDLGGDAPWFAMEYVDGQTLEERVQTAGPLFGKTLEDFAKDLAYQIHAIHQVGLVHRDIKPSNVVVSTSGARIIDFGVAHADGRTAMTETGQMVGTLAWASPEQVAGDPVGQEADIHAWGLCVLYAATGEKPFPGDSIPNTLYQVVHTHPPIPQDLPRSLAEPVAEAVRKDPRRRPSVGTLIEQLGGAPTLHPRPEGTDPTEPIPIGGEGTQHDNDTTDPRGRKKWILATVAIVGAATLATVAAMSLVVVRALPSQPSESSDTATNFRETPYQLLPVQFPETAQINEALSLEAEVVPRIAGGIASLQLLDGAELLTLTQGITDDAGRVRLNAIAPGVSGEYRYQIKLDGPNGETVLSQPLVINVERLPTRDLRADWPTEPVRWCQPFEVTLRLEPEAPGRSVDLQVQSGGAAWTTVDTTEFSDDGRATLTSPDCEAYDLRMPDSVQWRVRTEATDVFTAYETKAVTIPTCPAPGPISFTTTAFNEFAPLNIVMRNDDPECTAFVRISATMICYNEAEPDGPPILTLGLRISDPVLAIDPESVRSIQTREIFTDSQARCREYYPIYNVIPEPETIEVAAEYFAYSR